MTVNWNPNAKQVEGLEHAQAGHAHVKSVNYQDQWAITFEAEHTGLIDAVQIFLPGSANAAVNPPANGGLFAPVLAELHVEGNEATGAPIHDIYTPTAMPSFTGAFTLLDYSYGVPDVTDVQANLDGAGIRSFADYAYFDLQFGTGAFPLNRRIIRWGVGAFLNFSYFAQRAMPAANWEANLPSYQPNTLNFAEISFYHSEGYVPSGSSDWALVTPQTIRDFRASATNFYRIASTAAAGAWLCDHVRMHVVSVPENRIGVGIKHYNPSSIPDDGQWFNIPLTTPAGTGAPSVTSGSRYTLIVRRIGGDFPNASAQSAESPFRILRGYSPETDDYLLKPVLQKIPDAAPTSYLEAFWQNGTIEVTGLGAQVEGIPCVRFASGGVIQPESQPYNIQTPAPVFGVHDLVISNAPATGFVVTQSIAISGTGEQYGQVMVTCGWHPANQAPDQPLVIEVRNNVNALVLGPVQITAAEWSALPDNLVYSNTDSYGIKYKRVRLVFPTAAALSAGTYTVKAMSSCLETRGWKVGLLYGDNDSVAKSAKLQSMGGTLEQATGAVIIPAAGGINPSNTYLTFPANNRFGEAQMALATVPPAPTGVTAVDILVGAHHVDIGACTNPGDPKCAEETVPGIRVAWSLVSDPNVTTYQIQRKDEGGEFQLVALVGPTTTEWVDFESDIGNLVCYRIRAYRANDDVTGAWSTEQCASIPAGRVALSFTSNWATGMAVTLPEAWEGNGSIEREFLFAEYGDVERRVIYGKNGQTSHHPVERRGVVFTRLLLLNALVTVAEPTVEIIKPMRDLSWAQIPYVCVRDGEGNRWFASILVPSIVNKRRGERWFAEVEIAEATTLATPVDTSLPQVTKAGLP